MLSIAAVLGLATIALYGRDVIGIFRGRKRRQLELNTRMAALSFASLAGAALLGVALVLTGAFAAHVGAFAFLAVFGWLSGLVLAKLYKIVAFLTWLETYGPVMGRAPTPRVQDLVAEARASKWFVDLLRGRLVRHADAAGRPTVGIPGGRGDDDRRHRRHRPGSDPDAAACGRREPAAPSGRRVRAASAVCQKLKMRAEDETKGRSMTDYIDVDVRPILRAGGEPFSVIMAALERLEPGQGLRLYATFKPIPLFAVMADKGFAHSAQALDAGEWEVLFTPAATKQTASPVRHPGLRRLAGAGRQARQSRPRSAGADGPDPRSRREARAGRNAFGAAATRARLPVPATREAWISLAWRLHAGRRHLRTDRQGSVMTDELVDRIRDALRVVIDPELGHNIVDLGFVYDISVVDGAVRITMTATTPGCPATRFLKEGVANAPRGCRASAPSTS